jgi:hypothetical protein
MMYALNIQLITKDGEAITLPWLRAVLTLARVQVLRSAVKDENTFAALLRYGATKEQLEYLAVTLRGALIDYRVTVDDVQYASGSFGAANDAKVAAYMAERLDRPAWDSSLETGDTW